MADHKMMLDAAEHATSMALRTADVTGKDHLAVAEVELVRECLSLARTLITNAKIVVSGGSVNKAGFVQGSASRIDTLCAEVAVRRSLKVVAEVE